MTDTPDIPNIALIGNPNCGKSTLFNALTRQQRKTGNWTGVTVDASTAQVTFRGAQFNITDLPGVYALSLDQNSADEQLVVDLVGDNSCVDLWVNVINAEQLERNLFLTTELIARKLPMLVVVNMSDRFNDDNPGPDCNRLAALCGCPVLCTSALTGDGLNALLEGIDERFRPRGETDDGFCRVDDPSAVVRAEFSGEDAFEQRLQLAREMAAEVQTRARSEAPRRWFNADRWLTHPVTGLLGFFAAMYLMFFFAINVANVFVDFFDLASHALLVNGGSQALSWLGLPQWLVVLLSEGLGGGVQTVATFIPVIGFLFLFLTLLEQSGYMARAAFVMNDLLSFVGISGKAFVPLIVSFGCNVPAVMATRQLGKRDERIITTLMAPFMSCGARLSVYALFVAAFFTEHAALIVFALYMTGIVVAFLTGYLMRKTVLPGNPDPFLLELPPWQWPGIVLVLKTTWRRLKGFLFEAGKIIVLMVLLLQVIGSLGRDFSWGNQDSDNSMLAAGAQWMSPVFEPMGIDRDNWPAVVGLFSGLLAKEVMVGTLDSLYGRLHADDTPPPTVGEELGEALRSVRDNGAELLATLADPLGLSILTTGSEIDMAENQAVDRQLFGLLREQFISPYGAFAYLLFVLLYFPCVTVIGAVARESGVRWAVFTALWSTSLAYLVASNFYQLSQFTARPLFASLWLAGSLGFLTAVVWFLRRKGRQLAARSPIPVVIR